MVSVNDLKTGLTIKYKGVLYQVIDFQHVKPGKGSAFVRTKLRNIENRSIQDITFNAGEKVEKAQIDKKNMQFLYAEGDIYYFMDMETYEQLEVAKNYVEDVLNFLDENMMVTIVMNEGRIIGINVPEKVELDVVEAEPAIKGDTKSGGDKGAVLSTGYNLRVPLFVEAGDRIVVNTEKGTYVSRV